MKPPSLLVPGAFPGNRPAVTFAVALCALSGGKSAEAADVTWSGTTAVLTLNTNWVGGSLPNNGTTTADRWVFGAAGAGGTTLTGARAFGGMLFNAGAPAYTIGTTSNSVNWNVTSSAITNNSSNIQTINYNLAMAQARTFTGSTPGGDLIVNGALSGGGNIAKTGTNNLTITSAASTLSNNFNISGGGTLTFGATGTVGAKNTGIAAFNITNATFAAAPGIVTSGGNSSIVNLSMKTGSQFTMADGVFNTFEVTGAADLYNTAGTAPIYTFNLGGTSSADVLAFTAAPAFTFAGSRINITPVSALSVGSSYTVVTAPGGLDNANSFVLGTGVATFGNTTYTLSINNAATATSIGVIAADLAKAYYSGAQGTTLNAGTPGASTNWLDAASGGGDTLIQPSAVTELHFAATGASNTTIAALGQDYTAISLNFNNSAGSVSINDSGSNKITVGSGGINVAGGSHAINVPLDLSTSQTFANGGMGILTIGGNINSNGNILSASGAGSIAINGNITNSGGFVKDGAGTVTIAGDIGGTGGLTKNGTGTLVLNGAKSYSGTTAINQGTVRVSTFAALGTDTSAIVTGGTGTTSLVYTGTGETVSRNIAPTNNFSVTLTQSGTSGTLIYAGGFLTGSAFNRTLVLDGSGTAEFSGVIDNGDATRNTTLTKNGTGTWSLTGENLYRAATNVNQGTLTVSGSGTLGATTGVLSVNNTNTTEAGTGTVLNLSTTLDTIKGTLSGTISTPLSGTNTATINNGGTGRNFTINQTAAATFAGVIAGGGDFTLGSESTNKLTLSGINTYTGNTTINAGTLVIDGSISTSLLTTVNSGGTLGGVGTVGATIVAGGGILAPGNSIGTLNFSDTLSLAGISNFEIDPTLGVGANADRANVINGVIYGGTLNVLYAGLNTNFAAGMIFNLFDASSFANSFSVVNLPSLTDGLSWQNDLATNGSLTVVPEPNVAMLIGSLGMLALLRRRRA